MLLLAILREYQFFAFNKYGVCYFNSTKWFGHFLLQDTLFLFVHVLGQSSFVAIVMYTGTVLCIPGQDGNQPWFLIDSL